ncbi:LysR family transcriptional regulator [Nocardia terpenica]|uniref:LysR family transcriptional regulator n=1 Tax=Nocardia terpenica TaxID=455432 RepID=A0A291RJK6_9NOCA|nr:LysR family transcriptional regulator [Nocardia terpenica]ATL67478.1 LysR family transcriptional regulator [Nocardia terpenica]
MDVVAACRAFVAVGGQGSFTAGAAAAEIPQSVASRRIAALERHFGARLFTRSARSATLTPFGREMLPTARRLVELAEAMDHDAERAKLRPFRVAVPANCPARLLARLVADGRRHGLTIDPHPAAPAERAALARTQEVRAALVAAPPEDAAWRIPLGVADGAGPHASALYLATLRPGRADRDARRRRVWIQPEDDVPHIRDRLTRLRDALGLQPGQVVVAASPVAAMAEVLDCADLLLCAPGEARELGLHWRPIGELDPARGYDIAAAQREDAGRLRELPEEIIGRCLGAPGPAREGGSDRWA